MADDQSQFDLAYEMRSFASLVREAGFSDKLGGDEASVLFEAAEALERAAVVAKRIGDTR